MVKVLIVEDSAFMRKIIGDILESSKEITVVGTARNGKEALEKIKELSPDVVTMDVEMPVMNGLECLKVIMNDNPLPVLMLSAHTSTGAEATITALELGAIDFITKPKNIFKVKTDEMQEQIIEQVIVASKINVSKNRFISTRKSRVKRVISKKSTDIVTIHSKKLSKIIAIGTSTGGPRALQEVIPKIPGDIDAAILIVQHMPPGFTKSLAERLDGISELTVIESQGNEELLPGYAYLAPGDKHLKIVKKRDKYFTYLDDGELVSGHKPSVDALYKSINEINITNVIGVIMTGMGRDGAKEMEVLRKNKNYTIAQNQESCVVFGMPKSAIELDAVDEVVELDKITNSIMKAMEV